jgi:hypothetical protein
MRLYIYMHVKYNVELCHSSHQALMIEAETLPETLSTTSISKQLIAREQFIAHSRRESSNAYTQTVCEQTGRLNNSGLWVVHSEIC